MMTVVLLICAFALILTAIFCFAYEKIFLGKAIRTQARVTTFAMMGEGVRSIPIVEFQDENGKWIQHRVQKSGSCSVNAGDIVPILYTRKKVGQSDVWNIFILAKSGGSPFVLYRFAGALTAMLGICFVVLAVLLGMR